MNEWNFEPNKMFFEYSGFKCEIIRHDWGFLNTYVLIPETNILYGIDELELNSILKPTSEITYSTNINGFWKIGISFSSIKDYIPNEPECEKPEFMENLEAFFGFTPAGINDYKNLEYAINEIKSLVDKILIASNH